MKTTCCSCPLAGASQLYSEGTIFLNLIHRVTSVPGWICSPPGGMVSGAKVLLAHSPSQHCFTADLAKFQVLPPLSCLKTWCRSSLPPTQANTVYHLQENVTLSGSGLRPCYRCWKGFGTKARPQLLLLRVFSLLLLHLASCRSNQVPGLCQQYTAFHHSV